MKSLRLGRFLVRLYRKFNNENFDARTWSNNVLKSIAPLVKGNVVNVSGGEDGDKNGSTYRQYFAQAASYAISNYGDASDSGDINLDLETSSLPQDLQEKFDAVFTHTVLEHVFDVDRAVTNLCAMSKDLVVTVVPFIQSFHHGPWYSDYWRFTPPALIRLFEKHSFKTVFMDWNDDPLGNVYIIHVATKYPERWWSVFGERCIVDNGPGWARTQITSADSKATRMASALGVRSSNGYFELITK